MYCKVLYKYYIFAKNLSKEEFFREEFFEKQRQSRGGKYLKD